MPRPRRARNAASDKQVEALRHRQDTRTNIPTAEYQSLVPEDTESPLRLAYARRNRDLDPQLVWRGKDEQDLGDLEVNAPTLYIQEKVRPKALIDDLLRQSRSGGQPSEYQVDMFADFNGLPDGADRTEFYRHDGYWQNRMILGDALQVMASLAERESLQGKVQCIYIDPPYGIRFNSNFQWSTTSRDVRDGNRQHITREPEQVKAFRDTWRDGIHSYLTYLRDRLTVARDLLADSGSIFVQIGDENVHRVRALMDEVFGDENFVSLISYPTSIGLGARHLDNVNNYLIWYSKSNDDLKYRPIYRVLVRGESGATRYTKIKYIDGSTFNVSELDEDQVEQALNDGGKYFTDQGLTSRTGSATTAFPVEFQGRQFRPSVGGWRTSESGMGRVNHAGRILRTQGSLRFQKNFDDFGAISLTNNWEDVSGGVQSRNDPKVYVVQTATNIIERCILMTTDPGDLVLDPTCGSGTTAYVAEQWGRRWITVDTSRVALALARARIMGARYPYYTLADSRDGQLKEAELSRRAPSEMPTYGNVRQGFVYQRVPHVTLRDIANNAEIDVIWEEYQEKLEPLREQLSAASGQWSANGGPLEEWEIPRERPEDWPPDTDHRLTDYWNLRIARQKEIDASIAARAEYEYLYDKPYEDRGRVRVAGPFTVESISPHRVLGVDENGDVIDSIAEPRNGYGAGYDFGQIILDNLRRSGVQQARREDRIAFASLTPWPGRFVCAEGRYSDQSPEAGGQEEPATDHYPLATEKRAAIFIGPEFGTVSRPDLVEAAREAADGGFDVLIACAFNYDAHTTEFESLGRVPVLKARMNADLHMAGELRNTGSGNLFVIFGEPDIDVLDCDDGQIQVRVNGVDVFHPNTGEVRSDGPDGIACWFIDTDYNQESFFVRHAYFLGAGDPYKSLKTTLKAEINEDAWATLHSAASRPFPRPESGRIAVKVINHLGDEVMKVFRVG